ncbi:MAG: peptidase M16 [Algoriphagus sp. 32-45-6]|nr:MAG: peptidase M16 [Algoriphagus sp. 32-45-6]
MVLDRSKAPEYSIPADFDLLHPKKGKTKTGLPYYYFQTPAIDAVKIEVIGKSSRHLLPIELAHVPSFTLQMIQEGTKDKSDEELAEFFDFHATEVGIHLTYTQEGLHLLTTKKHLHKVLPVFMTLFSDSTFPSAILEKKKNQRKLSLKIENEKSSSRASTLFRSGLFGPEHIYGQQTTEEHIDAIHPELLVDYYQNHLWKDVEIFISGNLDPDGLDQVLSFLEKIPTRQQAENFSAPKPKTIESTWEDRKAALQSSLRVGSWSIPKKHPDFLALSVFNTLLGGYFGSRLVKNIREEKGHTYGISSNLAELGEFNYWVIGADVEKQYRELVLEEVKEEIKKLSLESISESEIEIVRNYLIGQMLSQFSSPFDLVDRFKSVHYSGLALDYYEQKLNFLKRFTAQDIQEVGRRYFLDQKLIEVVVG